MCSLYRMCSPKRKSFAAGIMVLDNQLRAKVDDGSSYVHYGLVN